MKIFKEIKQFFIDNPKTFWVVSRIFILLLITTWLIEIFHNKIPKDISDNLNTAIDISTWLSKLLIGIYVAWEFFDKQLTKSRIAKLTECENEYRNLEGNFNTILSELTQNDINLKKQCRNILRSIFEKYRLDSSCRISLYYTQTPSRNPEQFYIMERYSTGGEQAHFKPEKSYKISYGFLRLVWMNEIYKDSNNCPEYKDTKKNRKRSTDDYEKYQRDTFGLEVEDIKSQKMKSCDFLGMKFSSENDVHIIILIESRKKGKLKSLNEQSINTFLKNSHAIECLLLSVSLMIWLIEKRTKHQKKIPNEEIEKSELIQEYNETRS